MFHENSSWAKKKLPKMSEKIPVSEEELLQKPFYTVEEPVSTQNVEIETAQKLLPSLAEAQSENYREILPKLLLSVKIQNPVEFRNLTVSH